MTLPPKFAAKAIGAAVLALMMGGIWWWHSHHWRPDMARWPIEGAAITPDNGPVDWRALVRSGASFAFIEATSGARANGGFERDVAAARAAGLRGGALHHFSLCQLATDQAAAFVRLVARDAAALPAVTILEFQDNCDQRPTRALLLAELTTFLNQIDTHTGKRTMIAPSPEVEDHYELGRTLDRPLWLLSNRTEPETLGQRYMIWQANDALHVDGATGNVRWLVLNSHDGTNRGNEAK